MKNSTKSPLQNAKSKNLSGKEPVRIENTIIKRNGGKKDGETAAIKLDNQPIIDSSCFAAILPPLGDMNELLRSTVEPVNTAVKKWLAS